MAHFAKLDANNVVEQVIVVADSDSGGGTLATESVGISFCKSLYGDDTNWKQTSYNQNFRGRYAGIGFTYMTNVQTLGVASTDIFIEPESWQPASWGIGKTHAHWISPLPKPSISDEEEQLGKHYEWYEAAHQADSATPKTVGWALTVT